MRYIATALVVLMVVLAGCNTGGTGGTPTAETTANGTETGTVTETGGTATPAATETDTGDDSTQSGVDASEVPGMEGSRLTNSSALVGAFSGAVFTGPADFETSYEANSERTTISVDRFTYQVRNDTQQQLYVANSSTGTQTYFVDGDQAAVRNDTSGEIRYSNETNSIGAEASFTSFYAVISLSYIKALEWEATDTTTVHGEEHYVLEASELNETGLAQTSLSADNVTSADGRLVVGADGVVHSGRVSLSGDADVSTTYSLRTDDSIDVTQPDWYDESQAS